MGSGFAVVGGVFAAIVAADAPATEWSLTAAVQRAWAQAPQAQTAQAQRDLRHAEREGARAWLPPRVSARVDNGLGQEDGRGGYDVTELTLAQPLPLARAPLTARADAALAAAAAAEAATRLRFEREVAESFHALQLRSAQYGLAQQRATAAQNLTEPRGGLVRYLTRTERLRLRILQELAQQALAASEGEWGEAEAQFRALLQLTDGPVAVEPLSLPPAPPPLPQLEQAAAQHPALVQTRNTLDAAYAEVAVARARRWPQMEVSAIGSRQYIAGERREVTGVGVGITLPLGTAARWPVAAAQAEVTRARAEHAAAARALRAEFKQAHTHLLHLRAQAEHYRTRVLTTATQAVRLVRRDFNAGNVNVLALVDAENTYYEAQARHLELLYDAWREWAALRAGVGIALADGAVVGGAP